jgi:hypothetical protein
VPFAFQLRPPVFRASPVVVEAAAVVVLRSKPGAGPGLRVVLGGALGPRAEFHVPLAF